MRNRKPIVVLLLATAGIGGCDYDPNEDTVQRDVYTKLEDCIADWGSKDLCVQTLKEADKKQQQAASGSTSTVFVPQYIFSGPGYYPGNRYVTTPDGSMFRPSGQRAFTVNSFARSSVSPSTARGGFGGAGRAAVSGFSGGGG